jgi:hypothetical protein
MRMRNQLQNEPEVHTFSKAHHYIGIAYLLILGVGATLGIYQSLDWPITSDASIFTYVLWRVENGATLYRDVFENNMPGTYLLQWMVQSLFGRGDLAFRLFDLFVLLLNSALIITFVKHISWLYAVVAALFFINIHLSEGAPAAAQRDFLMVPFLLGSALCLRIFLQSPTFRPRLFLAIGALCGFAFWIKPPALVFAALAGVVACWRYRPLKHILKITVWGIAGFLIPAAIIHLWLYQQGAVTAFYEMLTGFLPVYSRIRLMGAVCWPIAITLLFILLYPLHKKSNVARTDKIVIAIGLLYGVIHFCSQQKGWYYHLYPLWAFLFIYLACYAPKALFKSRGNAIAMHTLSLLFAAALGSVNSAPVPSQDPTARVTADVNNALKSIPPDIRGAYIAAHPHEYVHFFDFTHAGFFRAAYKNEWITPSRHTYPFALYNKQWDHAVINKMAEELFHDLQQAKPLLILVSREAWPWGMDEAKSYAIIESDEPWKVFFANNYRLQKESASYRIYARFQ